MQAHLTLEEKHLNISPASPHFLAMYPVIYASFMINPAKTLAI